MAWQSNVNVGPGDLDLGMFEFKEFLKAQGWTIGGTGDGDSNFSNAGTDVITSSGSGPNGIANTDSWWRIQSPDLQREYLFYRPSGVGSWILRYSQSSGFTGGTPGANTPPTAADEVQFGNNIGGSDANYIMHMAVQDTAEDGFYSWWFIAREAGTGLSRAFAMAEVLESFAAADGDPVVHCVLDQSSLTETVMDSTNDNAPQGFDPGVTTMLPYPTTGYSTTGGSIPGDAGLSLGQDVMLPIVCKRNAGAATADNFKGFMRHHRWIGASGRHYTDVLEDDSGNLFMVADEIGLEGWPDKITDPSL